MCRLYTILLVLLFLSACDRAEKIDLASIKSNRTALQDKTLEVHGTVIEPKGYMRYITTGTARYFVLTDGKKSINVWYNVIKLHCPPYPGSTVSVVGKMKPFGAKNKLHFMGKSLDYETKVEPPEGTVRLCSLNFEEAEIYAREGKEGLLQRWRQRGRSVLNITTH